MVFFYSFNTSNFVYIASFNKFSVISWWVISFIAEGMPDYKRTPFSDTIYVVTMTWLTVMEYGIFVSQMTTDMFDLS
jgi:hypothetical protein